MPASTPLATGSSAEREHAQRAIDREQQRADEHGGEQRETRRVVLDAAARVITEKTPGPVTCSAGRASSPAPATTLR